MKGLLSMKKEIRINIACDNIQDAYNILAKGILEFDRKESVRPLTLIGKQGLISISEQITDDKGAPFETREELLRDLNGNESYRKIKL
jgi:hypothetical protein